jgi:hypothetical protein
MVRRCAEVDKSVFIAILAIDRSQTIGQRMPPLELSTPETSEVTIYLSVVILKHTGIDRERTTNRLVHRLERTFGLVSHSNTQTEDTVKGFCREDQIVLTILLNTVIVPHLLLSPGHLLHIEDYTMISSLVVLYIIP